MTSVNATNLAITTANNAEGLNTTQSKESLAAVLSALTKTDIRVDNLGNQRISEAILYAALVHQKLDQTSPKSAQYLLNNLRGKTRQNIKDLKNQPLFQAVDSLMQKMVSRGNINRNQLRNIRNEAFGRAQLDSRTDHLRHRNVVVPNKDNHSGNIEAAIARAADNSPASRQDRKDFSKHLNQHPSLTPAQARARWKLLKNFKPEEAGPVSTKATPISGDKKINPTDNIVKMPTPKISDNKSGPDELAYYPAKHNGNLSVLLPLYYTDKVSAVRILNGNGDQLAQLSLLGRKEKTDDGDASDGRAIWTWDQPASKLPDKSIILELGLIDSSVYNIYLLSDQFYKRGVAR